MTTDNPVARFLGLERQATELLGELEKLREETDHYSTAAAGMDNAMSQLASVSNNLKELSARLKEMIESLRSIGTPELLAKSQATQEAVDSLRKEVKSWQQQSATQFKAIADYERRGFFAKLFGSGPRSEQSS